MNECTVDFSRSSMMYDIITLNVEVYENPVFILLSQIIKIEAKM